MEKKLLQLIDTAFNDCVRENPKEEFEEENKKVKINIVKRAEYDWKILNIIGPISSTTDRFYTTINGTERVLYRKSIGSAIFYTKGEVEGGIFTIQNRPADPFFTS